MDQARKFDTNKRCWSACPTKALEELADVMTMGMKKYGKHNYLQGGLEYSRLWDAALHNYLQGGLEYSRLWDAALRHLCAWYQGEDKDEESGLSHLAHAMACCGMLLEYQKRNLGKDDRK
jgi:hypothetical protein